jgi:type III pantothenate kinase
MILAVDIGNSNITLGGFAQGTEPCFVAHLSTDISRTEDEYAYSILGVLSLNGIGAAEIGGAIISSVVPALNEILCRAIHRISGTQPLTVGPGIKTGINIHCDTPSSVGADLICACVAAHHLYGDPSLIVDMGTATKMMVVNRKATFIGVSIMPGVHMGLGALIRETAQLPQISLATPPAAAAKNTIDSMRSGVLFGHAAMVDGMIDRICEELSEQLPVLATGGYADSILPHCRHAVTYDATLVLKGLRILYEKNTAERH